MSAVTVWRAANYVRMPWKNGGGSTEEISRDGGHGLEGFGWRLSIADIGESGGFSTFAGYQRVITVINGAGMVLTVDGEEQRGLLPLQPFAFKGDSQVSCRLISWLVHRNRGHAPSHICFPLFLRSVSNLAHHFVTECPMVAQTRSVAVKP